MGLLSKIRDRIAVGRMADALDVEGQRRYPTQVNTEAIQPVYVLNNPVPPLAEPSNGFGDLVMFNSGILDVATETSQEVSIIGDTILTPNALDTGAYRVDAIEVTLILDAAGMAAFDQKEVAIVLEFVENGGDPPQRIILYSARPAYRILNGAAVPGRVFIWALGGASAFPACHEMPACTWNRAVPPINPTAEAGWDGGIGICLNVTVTSIQLAAFPANTTLEVKAMLRKGTNGIIPLP